MRLKPQVYGWDVVSQYPLSIKYFVTLIRPQMYTRRYSKIGNEHIDLLWHYPPDIWLFDLFLPSFTI